MRDKSNQGDSLAENGAEIKLAGNDNKEKMYEPKHKRKLVRVFTVITYVFSVSLAAIMLSLFYIFIYNPSKPADTSREHTLNDLNHRIQQKDFEIIPEEMGKGFNYSHIMLEKEEPRALPVKNIQTVILKGLSKSEDAVSGIVKESLKNYEMYSNVSLKKIINYFRFQ